jgi:dUTP pyrophosphatase
MSNTEIGITRLPHAADLPLPENSHRLDLVAAVLAGKPVVIAPGERAAIPTGLVFTLPRGVNTQIWPRTGLAFQYGITALNGLLDPDYRGEVHVNARWRRRAARTCRRASTEGAAGRSGLSGALPA